MFQFVVDLFQPHPHGTVRFFADIVAAGRGDLTGKILQYTGLASQRLPFPVAVTLRVIKAHIGLNDL